MTMDVEQGADPVGLRQRVDRDAVAMIAVVSAVVAASVGGFCVSLAVGFFVTAAALAALGLLLGYQPAPPPRRRLVSVPLDAVKRSHRAAASAPPKDPADWRPGRRAI